MSSFVDYINAMSTQRRVILALFLREARTRFGRKKLGIFWGVLEPILHIAVFAIIGAVIERFSPYSIPYILFLTSGVVPYFLFRNTYRRTVTAVRVNRTLLVFPQITFMDFTISRALLELLISVLSFALILSLYVWFLGPIEVGDFVQALFAFLSFFLLGCGLGMFMRPLIALIPLLEQIMSALIRVLYFASCVMIAPEKIPEKILRVLQWNPILHCLELFRGGLLAQYWVIPELDNWMYIFSFVLVLFALSSVLEKRFYRQIINED